MLRIEASRRLSALPAQVAAAVAGSAWETAPVEGDAVECLRRAERDDTVERTLRFGRPAAAWGRWLPVAAGFDEESVCHRAHGRVELVLVPHDGRLAALCATKGQVTVEADPPGSRLTLRASVRVRLPGLRALAEPALAAALRAHFERRAEAVARALRS